MPDRLSNPMPALRRNLVISEQQLRELWAEDLDGTSGMCVFSKRTELSEPLSNVWVSNDGYLTQLNYSLGIRKKLP